MIMVSHKKYLLILILLMLLTITYLMPLIISLFSSSSRTPLLKLIQTEKNLTNDDILINLPFIYLIKNNCSFNVSDSFDIEIIQIVTSYAGNVEARSALRRAYPSDYLQKLGIYRVFLLAALRPYTSEVTQNAIINENERFHDLIQGNFFEAYKNLTYKHIMGLNWAVKYCKNINYIIKMDDDIIVDIYYLLNLIKFKYKNIHMLGYIFKNMRPIRLKANKWYVTKKEYDGNTYPPFLSGWLYVTSFKTAQTLVNQSTHTPFFWIDDVYVTGILTGKANIHFENMGEYFTTNPEYFECCIRDNVHCGLVAGPNGGDNNLQVLFQKHALKCHYGSCKNYTKGKSLNNSCVTQRKLPPLGKGLPQLNIIKL